MVRFESGEPATLCYGDFGDARQRGTPRFESDEVCGTEGWWAPELWVHHRNPDAVQRGDTPPVDRFACDVYSTGLCVFALMTGGTPAMWKDRKYHAASNSDTDPKFVVPEQWEQRALVVEAMRWQTLRKTTFRASAARAAKYRSSAEDIRRDLERSITRSHYSSLPNVSGGESPTSWTRRRPTSLEPLSQTEVPTMSPNAGRKERSVAVSGRSATAFLPKAEVFSAHPHITPPSHAVVRSAGSDRSFLQLAAAGQFDQSVFKSFCDKVRTLEKSALNGDVETIVEGLKELRPGGVNAAILDEDRTMAAAVEVIQRGKEICEAKAAGHDIPYIAPFLSATDTLLHEVAALHFKSQDEQP
jgi:serine/threonine protein kinase